MFMYGCVYVYLWLLAYKRVYIHACIHIYGAVGVYRHAAQAETVVEHRGAYVVMYVCARMHTHIWSCCAQTTS